MDLRATGRCHRPPARDHNHCKSALSWNCSGPDGGSRGRGTRGEIGVKHLWGYTRLHAAARACLLSLEASFVGHEVFYIVASDTAVETPSLELKQQFFPDVPLRSMLSGHRSFFDSSKAERLLGWQHDQP